MPESGLFHKVSFAFGAGDFDLTFASGDADSLFAVRTCVVIVVFVFDFGLKSCQTAADATGQIHVFGVLCGPLIDLP